MYWGKYEMYYPSMDLISYMQKRLNPIHLPAYFSPDTLFDRISVSDKKKFITVSKTMRAMGNNSQTPG